MGRSSTHRRTRWPRATVGLALAIFAVVPITGALALSVSRASEQRGTADQARAIEGEASRIAVVMALRFAVAEERFASETALVATRLGVDPALVDGAFGFRLADRASADRVSTDAAVAAARADGVAVDVLDDVAQWRAMLNGANADDVAVDELFNAVQQALDADVGAMLRVLRTQIARIADATEVDRSLVAVEDVVNAHERASAEVGRAGDIVVPTLGDSTSRQQLAVEAAGFHQAMSRLDASLFGPAATEGQQLETSAANQQFERLVAQLLDANPVDDPAATDIGVLAPAFAAGYTRAADLLHLLQTVTGQLVDAASVVRDGADRDYQRDVALALGFVLATAAAGLVTAHSITRPLRRLELNARAISTGDLDRPPLRERGPREVAVAAAAFNDMASSLRTIEQRANALAAGDFGSGARTTPTGALDEAVQGSVDRLAQSMAEREELRVQLAHEASHDPLTGLLNRPAAIAALNEMLAADELVPVAMLFVDLDGFKQVNDTHGHAVGDDVLREAARRLLGTVRASDVVARHGGDEFVVLLPACRDRRAAEDLARRVIEALSEPMVSLGVQTTISASVGIAVSKPGQAALDLTRDADVALYEAKAAGRHRVAVFDDARVASGA